MEERLAALWLSRRLGAGSRLAVRLLREFGSAAAVYEATEEEIKRLFPQDAQRILKAVSDKQTDSDAEILAFCENKKITVLPYCDSRYPKALLTLRDYPLILFAVGKMLDLNNAFCCSVVGTRKMSSYGKETAYQLGYGLAAGGATLVSGLALGIDGMAMAGALEGGGATVGVLGCGIDVVYPPDHRDLMRRVAETGLVLTEYVPGTPPAGGNFPQRNRIISGLSECTVVVEADLKSGALITARHALYQGRDLFAVPGRIDDPGAEGSNGLIKNGAYAVSHAAEILERYEFLYPHAVRVQAARKAVKRVHLSAEESAALLHVAARKEKRPFQGSGVYGGRKRVAEVSPEEKTKKKPAAEQAAAAKKSSDAKVQTVPQRVVDFDLLGEEEKNVYRLMTPDVPMLPDEICRSGNLPPQTILSALTMLEIAGAVEAGAGGYYIRPSGDALEMCEE